MGGMKSNISFAVAPTPRCCYIPTSSSAARKTAGSKPDSLVALAPAARRAPFFCSVRNREPKTRRSTPPTVGLTTAAGLRIFQPPATPTEIFDIDHGIRIGAGAQPLLEVFAVIGFLQGHLQTPNKMARVQIRSATLNNRWGGQDVRASEPLDRQVKVAWNDLHTPHPRRTVSDRHPCQGRT